MQGGLDLLPFLRRGIPCKRSGPRLFAASIDKETGSLIFLVYGESNSGYDHCCCFAAASSTLSIKPSGQQCANTLSTSRWQSDERCRTGRCIGPTIYCCFLGGSAIGCPG